MKRMIVGMALACAAVPAAATEALDMEFACSRSLAAQAHAIELTGQWDLAMEVGNISSLGLLPLRRTEGRLGGTLSLNGGVTVVRSGANDSNEVAMVVVTAGAQLRFDQPFAPKARQRCRLPQRGYSLEKV